MALVTCSCSGNGLLRYSNASEGGLLVPTTYHGCTTSIVSYTPTCLCYWYKVTASLVYAAPELLGEPEYA